jgi:hypothetical protein
MTRSIIGSLSASAQAQVREQLAKQNAGRIIATERKGKYNNERTPFKSRQGFELVAASKKEAKDYAMLDLGITTGLVTRWVPQVSFLLPGSIRYRCDALVWWADGRVTVRDAKGFETSAFRDRKKLMRACYGIEIEIVR